MSGIDPVTYGIPLFDNAHDVIALCGMRFHVTVGVLPHERELEQPLEIDVRLLVDRPSGMDEPLDYSVVYRAVAHIVGRGAHRFLEDLAGEILDALASEPLVLRAQVALRKPHAPVGGPLDYVGITRSRHVRD